MRIFRSQNRFCNTCEAASCKAIVQSIESEFFIDNLLVQNHFLNVVIRWTGLAPWEFKFPFPGSRASTFLCKALNATCVHGPPDHQ